MAALMAVLMAAFRCHILVVTSQQAGIEKNEEACSVEINKKCAF
jgi:hypothetical protein